MPRNNIRDLKMNSWITLSRTVIILFVILLLTACGGGGSGDPATPADPGLGGKGNGGGSGSTSYGAATLSWLPPTEYTDGSALTNNLAGYKIYYGTAIDDYTNVITIDNPGIATYLIDNLPAGNTYYFVVTAVDSDGMESEYSAVGSKTIPA